MPKVFISSTLEDLEAFRAKALEAILRLGWVPIDCRYWAAGGNPPLETCLQKVDDADVLVAIVAHRHGWTPPDQPAGEHKSITRLECERAREKGVEVIPFLVDERAHWDNKLTETHRINDAPAEKINEVAAEVARNVIALKYFKAWLEKVSTRKIFANADQLCTEVLHALKQWGEHRGLKESAGGFTLPVEGRIQQQITAYLRWLRSRTESIELRGIERAGGAPVVLLPLETAYVPLRARPMPRLGETEELMSAHGRRSRKRRTAPDEHESPGREADIELKEVLGLGNRLVIVGGPGSGKTTVLLHMAWAIASSRLSGQPDPARSRLGLSSAPAELPLPIFVPLASFARYRRGLPPNAPAEEKRLDRFILHYLKERHADFALPTDFFAKLLYEGRDILLLLDGLDEVANENERAEVRQSVEDLVSGREAMRVVVTCRTVAYRSGRTALGANFRELSVQPLDPEQHIAPMVRQAYACIYPNDATLRADRARDLLAGIRRLEDDRRARPAEGAGALVDSPLMVRLLLIVHFNNRTLPDERADLFDKAVNALLQVDYAHEQSVATELSTDWKLFRDMAQHLAFHMHQQGRDQGREIEEQALKKALREESEFQPRIDDFLRHARERGGVLEEREGAYRFIHLAFQEFLVARYLREVVGAEGREKILSFLGDRLEDPWWREPVLLLAGYMGANAAKSARDFLGALAKAGKSADEQYAAAELAATAAAEWRESGEQTRKSCAVSVVEILSDAKALQDSRPITRARAGDALARVGDPRFDRERFDLPADDMLGFVRISADPEFRIGTRKADGKRVSEIIGHGVPDDEINDAITPTPEFCIACYPVTVAQFRAFVEAKKFKIGDENALRNPDNRPVRYVSWHEALGYCEWLNEVLTGSPLLEYSEIARLVREGGWRVALPSELEWEKAARGGLTGAVFSWGDSPDPNRANYADSEIYDTSSVGCFPPNGFELYDMLGNVWEWTRSLWGTHWEKPKFAYPYRADDPKREALNAGNDVLRVLRGGSWDCSRDSARCASRLRLGPDLRLGYIGFRVVLCSAPVR
jgi:formylglycine-generating enzyme required for sulfatase activity